MPTIPEGDAAPGEVMAPREELMIIVCYNFFSSFAANLHKDEWVNRSLMNAYDHLSVTGLKS